MVEWNVVGFPWLLDKGERWDGDDGSNEGRILSSASVEGKDEPPRTSILMELSDRVGVLHDVLKYFWKNDVNITRIESRPFQRGDDGSTFDFFLDMDGSATDPNVQKLLQDLDPLANKVLILDSKDVYWFPRHISELDLIANRTLDAGVDLEADHPGFHDQEYRARRAIMAGKYETRT